MNNDENYVLQLGENEKFQYEVTPKAQGILEEVMFHSYCLAKNKKELDEIERCLSKNIYVANAEERIAELIYAIKDEEIQFMKDGILYGFVVQNPYNMGYEGFKNAVKLIENKEVDPSVDTKSYFVSMDNLEDEEIQQLLYPLN